MREKRDVDRLDFYLVSPVPPASPGCPAGAFSACPRSAGHRSSAMPKWFFRILLVRLLQAALRHSMFAWTL